MRVLRWPIGRRSLYEKFWLVLLEVMACGASAIASAVSDIGELIDAVTHVKSTTLQNSGMSPVFGSTARSARNNAAPTKLIAMSSKRITIMTVSAAS